MSSSSELEALSHASYWDERYSTSDGKEPTHEWFQTFANLEPFFARHLFEQYDPVTNPRILHLGSGDSTIPTGLARKGYHDQLCVDFSPVVVELMSKRHESEEGIEWICADVRHLTSVPDKSIRVAFDKGTLDAMIHGSPWDPPDSVKQNTGEYMKEVYRVLEDDGVFLYITYRQPHFVKPIVNKDDLWELQLDVLGTGQSSFEYFGFVLRKRKP